MNVLCVCLCVRCGKVVRKPLCGRTTSRRRRGRRTSNMPLGAICVVAFSTLCCRACVLCVCVGDGVCDPRCNRVYFLFFLSSNSTPKRRRHTAPSKRCLTARAAVMPAIICTAMQCLRHSMRMCDGMVIFCWSQLLEEDEKMRRCR